MNLIRRVFFKTNLPLMIPFLVILFFIGSSFHFKKEILTRDYLHSKRPVRILITSGASCPDALVEGVIRKLTGFFSVEKSVEEMIEEIG